MWRRLSGPKSNFHVSVTCSISDDLEDDEDEEPEEAAKTVTSPMLLHEVNAGPSVEIDPVAMEVSRSQANGGSRHSDERHYLTCKADNALAVHALCSATQPSVDLQSENNPRRDNGKSGAVDSKHTSNGAIVNALTADAIGIADIVNPMTGVRHIEIKAAMTEQLLQRFNLTLKKTTAVTLFCACFAFSSKEGNWSKVATIRFNRELISSYKCTDSRHYKSYLE